MKACCFRASRVICHITSGKVGTQKCLYMCLLVYISVCVAGVGGGGGGEGGMCVHVHMIGVCMS